MKISIIIPVYNVERYVERCIRSVMAQDYDGQLECVIVDDCSPDASMAIVDKLLAGYDGPIEFSTVRHDKNGGLSAARNTGIRHSSGDYLYFLDSDDAITPDCMSLLSGVAAKFPGVDIVQGNIVVTDELYRGFDISRYDFPAYSADRDWIRRNMLDHIPVMMWGRLIRRGLIEEHDLWCREGIIHEDEQWRFAALMHVSSIAFCPTPTYVYYRNPTGLTEAPYKDRNAESMWLIYEEALLRLADTPYRVKVLEYVIWYGSQKLKLREPDKFRERYHAVLNRQIHDKTTPLAIRVGLVYELRPNRCLKMMCRLFYRPGYRMIKHFKRVPRG